MSPSNPHGVLIAEDQAEIRELLAIIFEMEGFTVIQGEDGQAALDLFEQNKDDIILLVTDLGLPRLGGVELIQKVKKLKPSLRVIGTSGFGRVNVREEVLAAGGDEFFPKPFVATELVQKAKGLLGLT